MALHKAQAATVRTTILKTVKVAVLVVQAVLAATEVATAVEMFLHAKAVATNNSHKLSRRSCLLARSHWPFIT